MLATFLIFATKVVFFLVGTLFIGVFVGTALSMMICKALRIPESPRGTAYIVGKGWFTSLLKGDDEELDIATTRHRVTEIGLGLGLAVTGLFLFVAFFTDHPATPGGAFRFIAALLS